MPVISSNRSRKALAPPTMPPIICGLSSVISKGEKTTSTCSCWLEKRNNLIMAQPPSVKPGPINAHAYITCMQCGCGMFAVMEKTVMGEIIPDSVSMSEFALALCSCPFAFTQLFSCCLLHLGMRPKHLTMATIYGADLCFQADHCTLIKYDLEQVTIALHSMFFNINQSSVLTALFSCYMTGAM